MRIKIKYDQKYIIRRVNSLSIMELGVISYLDQYFFHPPSPQMMFDEKNGVAIKKNDIHELLLSKGISKESALVIISKFIEEGLYRTDKHGHIINTEIEKAQRISTSKVRVKPRKKHIPALAIQEPQLPIQQNKPDKPLSQEQITELDQNKKDILSAQLFLKTESEQSNPMHIAKLLLIRLNQKSERVRGFSPKDSNLRYIISRLVDGFTKQDIEKVIDYKCIKWKNTKSQYYLKPSTLFRPSNFEGYLIEATDYFERNKEQINHPLNDYINKWYKRIPKMNMQMSSEECDKINKLCSDKNIVTQTLTYMENRADLLNNESVFLTLKHYLEKAVSKQKFNNPIIKAGVRT